MPRKRNSLASTKSAKVDESLVQSPKQISLTSLPIMLLVLGPHRSGTSLVTRLLQCLGAVNSRHQMPEQADNPKGFFEDADIYQLNNSVLLPRLGMQWHSIGFVDWSRLNKADRSRLGLQALEIVRRNYPATQPLSVLKEPRIGVLLPFWLSVLGHAGFDVRIVCAVRDPLSVARSLAVRDGFSLTHGGMLYATSWLSILPHIEDLPVSLVEFDTIFDKPGKALRTVADKLQVPLPADVEERLHEFTSSHLEPSLRHSHLPAEDVALEPDLPSIAVHLHQAMLSATRSQNIRKVSRLALASGRTIEDFRPVLAEFDQLQLSRRAEAEKANHLQQHAEALVNEIKLLRETEERDRLLLAESTDWAKGLESELERTRALVEERTNWAKNLDAEVARLRESQERLVRCEEQRKQLVAERDERTKWAQSLESELERTRALVEERTNWAKNLDVEVARLRELQERLAQFEEDRKQLIAERDERTKWAQSLESELERTRALVEERTNWAKDLDVEVASLRESQERLVQCEEQRKQLVAERDTLNARLAALDSTLQDLEKQSAERNQLSEQISRLQTEREELAKRHDSLTRSFAEFKSKYSSFVAEHDTLTTRYSSVTSALGELDAKHSSLSAEREALSERIAELESLQASLTSSRDSAAEENSLLLQQLHQVQEELEIYFLRNKELKQQADRLRKDAHGQHGLQERLAEAEEKRKQLGAERDKLTNWAQDLQSKLEKARALVEERINWAKNLEAELQSARGDAKTLEDKVSARFLELAILAKTIAEGDEALQRAKEAALYRGPSGCCIETVSLADAQEHPPHNHLNVNLLNLQVGDSCWDTLRVRLIEHHSRPGLAIFESPNGGSPLRKWERSGEENSMPYMLLIPGDTNGERLLNEADGADFSFVQLLVDALETELNKSASSKSLPAERRATLQAWLPRARSLRGKIGEAGGAFLRHGQPRVQLSSEASRANDVHVTLPECYFAGRFFPVIAFTWKSDTDVLVFSAKENLEPPFVGSDSIRTSSLGSAVEARFETRRSNGHSHQNLSYSEYDISLAKAIGERLPRILTSLPSSFQRKARALKGSFLGEKIVTFHDNKRQSAL